MNGGREKQSEKCVSCSVLSALGLNKSSFYQLNFSTLSSQVHNLGPFKVI